MIAHENFNLGQCREKGGLGKQNYFFPLQEKITESKWQDINDCAGIYFLLLILYLSYYFSPIYLMILLLFLQIYIFVLHLDISHDQPPS